MSKGVGLALVLFSMSCLAQEQAAPVTPNPAAVTNQTNQGKMTDAPKKKVPVTPPVLTHSVEPVITKAMRKGSMPANVQIYCYVDEAGLPQNIRVSRGFNKDFDDAAVDAVRQYKFKPATQGGKPVKVDLYIDVAFN